MHWCDETTTGGSVGIAYICFVIAFALSNRYLWETHRKVEVSLRVISLSFSLSLSPPKKRDKARDLG